MFKRTSINHKHGAPQVRPSYAAGHAATAWFLATTLVPISASATQDCPEGTEVSGKYGIPAIAVILAAGIATGIYLWRREASFLARRVAPPIVLFIFLVAAVYITGFLVAISPCVPK